jgi:hypothetical protein|eukprot:COSAG06_NODE_16011_length_1029_cov_1.045161_2_plen_68_part_00
MLIARIECQRCQDKLRTAAEAQTVLMCMKRMFNVQQGLWYPPKSYYLEGDSSTAFQKQVRYSMMMTA